MRRLGKKNKNIQQTVPHFHPHEKGAAGDGKRQTAHTRDIVVALSLSVYDIDGHAVELHSATQRVAVRKVPVPREI